MNNPAETRTCLYNTAQLNAVVDNMARQAAAMLRGNMPVAIVGILRRGGPLADRLTHRLVHNHGLKPPLRLDLQVKRYADDLRLLHPETLLTASAQHATLDLSGHQVLLVDDVLYTGHSVMKVVPYLMQKNPACIQVACLVDRCTVRLPVAADVVGLKLTVAPTDIVECHVPPFETEFRIELVQPASPSVLATSLH